MLNPTIHEGMEGPALRAMETAQSGLDAWNVLPRNVRMATMEARNSLLNRRADAAVTWLLAMPRLDVAGLLSQQLAGLPRDGGAHSQHGAFQQQLRQDLKQLEKKQAQLKAAHEVLLEARLNKRPQSEEGLRKAIASVSLHKYDCSGLLMYTHITRLMMGDLPADVLALALALHDFLTGPAVEQAEMVRTLLEGSADADKLAAAADKIERRGDSLATLAERFCFAAAQRAGGDDSSELWQHVLACADAISSYFSPLLDLAAAVPRARKAASSSSLPAPGLQVSPPDEWAVVWPSPSQRPDKAVGKKKSRGKSRAQAWGTARRAEASSGAPRQQTAAAAPDALARVLERAENALAKQPLTLAQAEQSSCDPVRIAAALGKDTTVVQLMQREEHDPLSIAHSTRFHMQTWFGDPGPLRSARDELRSRPEPDDARMQRLTAQLDDRIEALERIQRRVDVDEGDAIKRHPFPKARHVERMLQLGAIEQVSMPKQLRAGNTPPGFGTLFEMVIVPTPMSDGSPTAPLYLHLHTDRAISVEACRKLSFDQFAAVHVKTAAQKDMGANWEQAQRSLGVLDAKVHRGKVGAQLLESVRNLSSRRHDPSGQGSSSRSLTGA
ncbi:MAG TPA: hypothetical protein VFL86_16560 [Burkholderiaceae bacterium]|nr:hypothetical protein [Burkholderiaceae bacterium]